MTAWKDIEQAEPAFAQRVRAVFDAHRHKTIATVRADGSPRISGIEAAFEDGDLVFGSMPNSRKGADLRRDPRFALHSATVDPVEGAEAHWPGEGKISGRAVPAGPLTDGADGDRYLADIVEVVHTHLNEVATMLVVEWWTPARGLRRTERELALARPAGTAARGHGPGQQLTGGRFGRTGSGSSGGLSSAAASSPAPWLPRPTESPGTCFSAS